MFILRGQLHAGRGVSEKVSAVSFCTEWAWQRKLLESGAPKIDRENVEDELDRGDCLTIGTEEKFENENEEGGMYFY